MQTYKHLILFFFIGTSVFLIYLQTTLDVYSMYNVTTKWLYYSANGAYCDIKSVFRPFNDLTVSQVIAWILHNLSRSCLSHG